MPSTLLLLPAQKQEASIFEKLPKKEAPPNWLEKLYQSVAPKGGSRFWRETSKQSISSRNRPQPPPPCFVKPFSMDARFWGETERKLSSTLPRRHLAILEKPSSKRDSVFVKPVLKKRLFPTPPLTRPPFPGPAHILFSAPLPMSAPHGQGDGPRPGPRRGAGRHPAESRELAAQAQRQSAGPRGARKRRASCVGDLESCMSGERCVCVCVVFEGARVDRRKRDATRKLRNFWGPLIGTVRFPRRSTDASLLSIRGCETNRVLGCR